MAGGSVCAMTEKEKARKSQREKIGQGMTCGLKLPEAGASAGTAKAKTRSASN